ncbi:sulfatase-like hydrolase/transferase [Sulfitobacter sp. D35]|uniref:sulfatase-like hydrolase/transferase n=1 Tax=Sulfitobacter sp. D35 TaxID=3083252 RepID=UPI00296E9D96|nr:sulfatase-like hydrolase/transferase [Sulfitobacter sp. D35]MDW4499335.1 sulfatase-like hydrolase/transferase [Sulfitobacter sp. D35]
MTSARNMLFLLSDEHNRRIAGCYGHPHAHTPNIDALAERGTRFTRAWCNSPICVPARAALATGRHVHETGHWDNAHPYDGTPPSWHHALRDQGSDVVSVGKLHFRGLGDHGFTEEILPLHVLNNQGDLKGLFRRDLPPKTGTADLATQAGPGQSSYCSYDERIADAACDWLRKRAASGRDDGFVLFVSFVMPHFPLIAPQDHYERFTALDLETLREGFTLPPPDHPTLNRMRHHFDYDAHFDDATRADALRAYFGMVSKMDALVGQVLEALSACGFADETAVLYASDHGDNLGNRGMWGKSVMFEDSLGIPMILAGPDLPRGQVCDTPVSLIDVAPTMTALAGIPDDYPGTSLFDIAGGATPDRPVLAQYHAAGSDTAMFALTRGRWKLVEYVDAPSQLFDLVDDPEERTDLAGVPEHAETLAALATELRTILDPEEVNDRAFADQAALIARHGGAQAIAASADIPFTPAPG